MERCVVKLDSKVANKKIERWQKIAEAAAKQSKRNSICKINNIINIKNICNVVQNYDILLVPYETVNKHSLMKCIIPDKVYILGVGFKKNVLVGLIDEKIKIDGADCILHPKLLEEI